VVPRAPSTDDLALDAAPNPSHESTDLSFTLDRKQRVTIGVFAVDGRRVRTLQRGVLEAGEHHVTWDGRDDAGRLMADGIYFAGLETAEGRATRRIARVR
jgi:flagellar hook assembly protein FlgD